MWISGVYGKVRGTLSCTDTPCFAILTMAPTSVYLPCTPAKTSTSSSLVLPTHLQPRSPSHDKSRITITVTVTGFPIDEWTSSTTSRPSYISPAYSPPSPNKELNMPDAMPVPPGSKEASATALKTGAAGGCAAVGVLVVLALVYRLWRRRRSLGCSRRYEGLLICDRVA